jgi:hypothetical protein
MCLMALKENIATINSELLYGYIKITAPLHNLSFGSGSG